MTGQLVDSFLDCFSRHVHILDATVAVKQDFADIVESQDNLRLIQLPSWAGLGAVQYVYAFFCYYISSVRNRNCIYCIPNIADCNLNPTLNPNLTLSLCVAMQSIRYGLLLAMFLGLHVCVFVSVLVTTVSPTGMAKSIEVAFGIWNPVGQRNQVLIGVQILYGKAHFFLGGGHLLTHLNCVKYMACGRYSPPY